MRGGLLHQVGTFDVVEVQCNVHSGGCGDRAESRAPWVTTIKWRRVAAGSSSNLRRSLPRRTGPAARSPCPGLRQRSENTDHSVGHFSATEGGTITTTGRFRLVASRTETATARATYVLPMPTSSAS